MVLVPWRPPVDGRTVTLSASVRARTGTAGQALPVAAWLGLLAATVLPAGTGRPVAVLLCVTTGSAALSLWLRVVLRASDRLPWAMLALGWTGYAAGFVIGLFAPALQRLGPSDLNLSDTVSLVLYPAGWTGLFLLARARTPRRSAGQLLDAGVVGAAATAGAVAWAGMAFPQLLHGDLVTVVYALAYPVGGATLLVVVLTSLAVSRWRVDRCWLLLALAFAVMTVGDAVYGAQSAAGTFAYGTPLDAAYTAGPLLVALAGWRRVPVGVPGTPDHRLGLAVPGLAILAAVGLLVLDHGVDLPTAAVALSAAAVVLGVARTALYLRQEVTIEQTRRDAMTDDLTGLWNRRALLADVQGRLREDRPTVLVLVDLEGVAQLNDTLGHTAGDLVLCAVAQRLQEVALPRLVARLVGDSFVVVADGSPEEAESPVDPPRRRRRPAPPRRGHDRQHRRAPGPRRQRRPGCRRRRAAAPGPGGARLRPAHPLGRQQLGAAARPRVARPAGPGRRPAARPRDRRDRRPPAAEGPSGHP